MRSRPLLDPEREVPEQLLHLGDRLLAAVEAQPRAGRAQAEEDRQVVIEGFRRGCKTVELAAVGIALLRRERHALAQRDQRARHRMAEVPLGQFDGQRLGAAGLVGAVPGLERDARGQPGPGMG